LNIFETQLEYSLNPTDSDCLNSFYRSVFPGMMSIDNAADDRETQRSGIDKFLHFKNGSVIAIEEKKRTQDYGDVFLETWSIWEQGIRGWLFTSKADWISYYVVPSNTVYMIPVLPLRCAWHHHGDEWIARYGERDAPNPEYTTKGVPVKWSVLSSAILTEMSGLLNGRLLSLEWNEDEIINEGV